MLEIIALVFLTQKIGDLAKRKGLPAGTWKVYTVLAWFAGEFIGMAIGAFLFRAGGLLMMLLVAYPCAIGGYHIVLSTLQKKPDIFENEINQLGENLMN